MKKITKEMILYYKLKDIGLDFAGYPFVDLDELCFHHTVISHKMCKELGLGEGYWQWNGSILVQNTIHQYLHTIEHYDYDRFLAIKSELIDENIKGYIDLNNLLNINDILRGFEREYCGTRNRNNNLIIKEGYTRRLIRK